VKLSLSPLCLKTIASLNAPFRGFIIWPLAIFNFDQNKKIDCIDFANGSSETVNGSMKIPNRSFGDIFKFLEKRSH